MTVDHQARVLVGPRAAATSGLPKTGAIGQLCREICDLARGDLAAKEVDQTDLISLAQVRFQLLREVVEELEEADQFP